VIWTDGPRCARTPNSCFRPPHGIQLTKADSRAIRFKRPQHWCEMDPFLEVDATRQQSVFSIENESASALDSALAATRENKPLRGPPIARSCSMARRAATCMQGRRSGCSGSPWQLPPDCQDAHGASKLPHGWRSMAGAQLVCQSRRCAGSHRGVTCMAHIMIQHPRPWALTRVREAPSTSSHCKLFFVCGHFIDVSSGRPGSHSQSSPRNDHSSVSRTDIRAAKGS
jgi:hypothetical protein